MLDKLPIYDGGNLQIVEINCVDGVEVFDVMVKTPG